MKPAITFRSISASLFALVVSAIVLQIDAVIVNTNGFAGEQSIPFPPILLLVFLVLGGAAVYRITRVLLLCRAELMCVLYIMLIATPLMTQAFWHRSVGLLATMPEKQRLQPHLDALSDRLWPHGPNLLDAALADPNAVGLETTGTVRFESVEVEPGKARQMPVLINDQPGGVASIRVRVPIDGGGERLLSTNEPIMVSVLVRPGDGDRLSLPSDSRYFARMWTGPDRPPRLLFTSSESGEVTYLQKGGFRRVVVYGLPMPEVAGDSVVIEFVLKGRGRLAVTDPKLFSVDAIKSAYTGKAWVTPAEYERLPEDKRAGVLVKPDNLWSPAGLRYIAGGYIPIRQWVVPALTWSALIGLIVLAAFALNTVFRKQWMDNERYLLPLAKIPVAVLGEPPGSSGVAGDGRLPVVWKNWFMWAGLGAAFFYTLSRGMSFYNPKLPDLSVVVNLKTYVTDPSYGTLFANNYFSISLIFLSIAMFMELNVLISIVVGWWLFKAQGWVGQATGLNANPGYPYHPQQQTGGYIAYALIILAFSRRHLWAVARAAVSGPGGIDRGEAISYRSAVLLLLVSFAGAVAWAVWVGVSIHGMLVFFLFILVVALVTAKLRAECGVPFSYLGLVDMTVVLAMFGGMSVFGPQAVLIVGMVSVLIGTTPFFLIPGAQAESIELSRRYGAGRLAPLWISLIGVAGGMLIGGWVFLSNSYAFGGETLNYSWAYTTKEFWFGGFVQELDDAGRAYRGEQADAPTGSGTAPQVWAYLFGGGATAATAILRQAFSGFWFHPIGILLGCNWLAMLIWGSCLTAWVIRLLVLRMGGAMTVRTKLQPFFVGVFLGTVAGHLMLLAYAMILRGQGITQTFTWSTIPPNLP